jgi:hypothetical protein
MRRAICSVSSTSRVISCSLSRLICVDVAGHRLVLPAAAAEQEALLRQQGRGGEEEAVDPFFAVGQAVAEKAEFAFETRVGLDRMVRRRIERVVDRHAAPRAEAFVGIYHRLAAAVGQHQVVARHQGAERVVRVLGQAVERGGGVDIPEHDARRRPLQFEHRAFEQRVEHADAAGLDHQVGATRVIHHAQRMLVALAGIDDHLGPVGVGEVAVLLPAIGVGLVEAHAVAPLVQRTDDAAVIGGGTVPVGRDQARSEEGDIHFFLAHAGLLVSAIHCSARHTQPMKLARPNARDTAEPALPGRWYRPLEGEAPQALRAWVSSQG